VARDTSVNLSFSVHYSFYSDKISRRLSGTFQKSFSCIAFSAKTSPAAVLFRRMTTGSKSRESSQAWHDRQNPAQTPFAGFTNGKYGLLRKCYKDLIFPKNTGFTRKPPCLSASQSTIGFSAKSRKQGFFGGSKSCNISVPRALGDKINFASQAYIGCKVTKVNNGGWLRPSA
jgi:hypothetical protein